MKFILLVMGSVAVLMGLLWIGQGANLVRWPASSFMIADSNWIWRGAALVVLGALAIRWSQRRR